MPRDLERWKLRGPTIICRSFVFKIAASIESYMSDSASLKIDGEVDRPAQLSRADLAAIAPEYQIADISQLDPKRRGRAVRLIGVLSQAGARDAAGWLTLHAAADDFHASIPLDAVRDRAVLIYELDGAALPASAGGPFRFFIPDFAACHTADVDECANVKFVDRIELSRERGHDNRPEDERQHAALHQHEHESPAPDSQGPKTQRDNPEPAT